MAPRNKPKKYQMQDVVGLGGSAGSIEALKTFFSYMPEESGLAFVVVLHLSPKYESSLEVVLQKWTLMPVIRVSEPIKVEANCVYVIPPRKHLLMADGHLTLTVLPHEYGKRSAVDIFFCTLAETHRSRSIAIVLSGIDGDGAIGVKRIKEVGGITLAQKPEEAQHDGMPRSAIETGMVDWVLPVAEMPRRLLENLRKSSS
jgi:two-component system, chemotaxis family, CheB/CheR fusion protein